MRVGAVIGMILLGILALLLVLLCIPIYFFAHYQTENPTELSMRWLFFRGTPGQKKHKKRKKTASKQPQQTLERQSNAKRSPQEFLELAGVVMDLLSSAGPGVRLFLRHLRIYRLQLQIRVVEEDAAQTAIAYGKTNAAIYGLYATAAHFLNMAIPQIEIQPDFTAKEGTVELTARARILPLFVLAAAVCIGWGFLVKTIQRRKNLSAEISAEDQKTAKTAENGGNIDE